MRGVKPPRVNPNAAVAGAILPTHATPAGGDDDTRIPPRPAATCRCCTCTCMFNFVLLCTALGLLVYVMRMDPFVSIDAVCATGLDAAGATVSPSFDVAVGVRMRWFHFAPSVYRDGTVAVSWASGAVSASGALQDAYLDPINPGVANATVRAPPTVLPADARERLLGELRRGEVHLDVSVEYKRDVGTSLGRGFRARCAAVSLGHGNTTASCSVK